ncbi:MAG: PRC-barrel domain-containing protein, partial [Candidatus Limnocylindrales bacterium]
MLEITSETNVYTAHDEHVGTVGRIVLDPETLAISHLVVRKGVLFSEDRLVPIADIATATAERINLGQEVTLDDLQPFVEQSYEPLPDRERPAGSPVEGVRLRMPMSGPVGETMPPVDAELVPVDRRNIPDRLTAVEADATVLDVDGNEVGRLERVITTQEGQPTHIVVGERGLMPDRRVLPIAWVAEITESAIALDASREVIE